MRRSICLTVFVALVGTAAVPSAPDQPPRPTGKDRVDLAVDKALHSLQSTQERDGSWTDNRSPSPAVTSLCVMAFLSAGHVPGEGRYGETVKKGIDWVLRQQKVNGLIAVEGHHEMYHHGICTLMLAEVAGMCDGAQGEKVRQQLEKAVELILRAQRTKEGPQKGGWRYRVEERLDTPPYADMSVTGWQLMALRAAKNLGCDVPAARIDLAVDYIKRSQDPTTGGFCYTPGGRGHGVTVPCTGTGILALEICGKHQHHSPEAVKAAGYLIKNPPVWGKTPHFFYGIYYCSQAAFQLGQNYWADFRPKLHKELLDNQSSGGHWIAQDGGSRAYGANYCTAMGVLALTVEYRFLPIYQRGEEPTDK